MNDNLSKLLSSFDQSCQQIIKSVQVFPKQEDMLHFIRSSCVLRQNDKKHNINFYTTSLKQHKDQGDENTTITNSIHHNENYKFSKAFLKIKQNMSLFQQVKNNQTTQNNYQNVHKNQKKQQNNNITRKNNLYKPNKMIVDIFSQNTLNQDFESNQQNDFTQKDKKTFFETFQLFQLKANNQKTKELQKSFYDENQENKNFYCFKNFLMAPKKQKLKKIKSNQQYQ